MFQWPRALRIAPFAVAFALAAMAAPANATFYSYNDPDAVAGGFRDNLVSISSTYDDVSQNFNWTYTLEDVGTGFQDVFWLVVSDGPNPRTNSDEYAILYGDINEGKVAAYVYNGETSSGSWFNPGIGIQAFSNALFTTTNGNQRTTTLSIGASTINSFYNTADWDGVAFGDTIGIWFHMSYEVNVAFDGDGFLTTFGTGHQSWYDRSNRPTTSTPTMASEPAGLALFGLGLLAAARRRRAD